MSQVARTRQAQERAALRKYLEHLLEVTADEETIAQIRAMQRALETSDDEVADLLRSA